MKNLTWLPKQNNLQPSYNEEARKITKQAQQEKEVKENLIFLINLTIITMVAKD